MLKPACKLSVASCCHERNETAHLGFMLRICGLQWFVHELLCFGAVHWCPVPPALSPMRAASMDSEHVAHLSARRQAAISIHGKQAGTAECLATAPAQCIAINSHPRACHLLLKPKHIMCSRQPATSLICVSAFARTRLHCF